MAVQLPVNSTGQVVDTATTVAGKERGVTVHLWEGNSALTTFLLRQLRQQSLRHLGQRE